MIRYKKYLNSNPESKGYNKWYAHAVAEETIGIDKLSAHMANHNTPFSKGCIKGVLQDMVACIKELLLEGKNVKIDNLAIFSVGMTTTGAETAKEFSPAANIKACTLRCRATGQLRPTTMKGDVEYREYGDYSSGATNKKTDTSEEGKNGL